MMVLVMVLAMLLVMILVMLLVVLLVVVILIMVLARVVVMPRLLIVESVNSELTMRFPTRAKSILFPPIIMHANVPAAFNRLQRNCAIRVMFNNENRPFTLTALGSYVAVLLHAKVIVIVTV